MPFCCDVVVGEPLRWNGGINAFITTLADALAGLAHEQRFPEWLWNGGQVGEATLRGAILPRADARPRRAVAA